MISNFQNYQSPSPKTYFYTIFNCVENDNCKLTFFKQKMLAIFLSPMVNVAGTEPLCGLREFFNLISGTRAVQNLFACVKTCQAIGALTINILVSQTIGWIDLPFLCFQFSAAQWRTRFSAIENMHLLSHRFGNEARSHVPRIWSARIFLITEFSLAHLVHWPRPSPLTPVLFEKMSAILRRQATAVPVGTFVKPNHNTGGFWKTFRFPNPRCWHCTTPPKKSIGSSDRRREPKRYDWICGTSCK